MSYRKTVKMIFHDAIEEGNWDDIRIAYKAIVGEEAPESPTPDNKQIALEDILNQALPMSDDTDKKRSMEEILDDYQDIRDGDKEDNVSEETEHDLVSGIQKLTQDKEPNVLVPDITPEVSDDPIDEFRIQHGERGAGTNEDGEQQCRRESMKIPEQRENRFHDNGKAFSDEKVTTHPEDKSLGVQSVRPRGLVRDSAIGNDTGSMVDVECGLCHKQEKVASSLSVGYNKKSEHNTYRCNDCNTPNGRAKVMRKQREENMNGNQRRGSR